MKYTIIIVCLLCVLGFSTPTLAQFNVVPQDDINVSLNPENPAPNQSVNVSIVSYSTNINNATVTWRVNGAVKKSGKGEKTFTFITGGLNTTTTLEIIVNTAEGQTIDKIIKVKPTSVDLLWQTDAFVPPFYKGKPLFSYQNVITFIALPHITNSSGAEISAKNLVYKWTLNGSVIDTASGYGKNTYALVGSIIARPLDVSVEVTGGSAVGIAQTTVSPISPSIIFYQKNPLYGIEFQKALVGNVELQGSKEITIVGMPFFFGANDLTSPELSYKWSINGTRIYDDERQSEQVFRQTEGVSGTSNISLSIENANKILQTGSSNFNLHFGI